MKKARTIFLLLLTVLLCIGMQPLWSAGAQEEEAEEPAQLWFNTLFHGGDAKAMEMIIERFNETHDDIEVDLTQGSWTEYNAQMTNAVIAGEAPQLGICLGWYFPAMYPAFVPLNDSPVGNLLEKMSLKRGDYIEEVWDIATFDGKQYGIPLDNTLLGVYYNKQIFREAGLDPDNPPDTLEAFEAACTAIKETGKYAFHPGAYGQSRWYRRMWYIFFWQKGGKLWEGNKATFNNEKGIEALEYLVSIPKKGWNKPGTNGAAQFEAGELGMMVNGTWHYLALAETNLDWGFMGIPKWFEHRYTWGGNHFLVIPKQTKENTDLLMPIGETLKWISENSHIWGMLGGHVPMRRSALENKEMRESDAWGKSLKKFSEISFEGIYHPTPVHPKLTEIEAAIEPYIDQAYNGTITPQEALDGAERDANKILKD